MPLVRRPSVLILDEPTFGQDRHGYERLLAILGEMVADGTCLIAATHDERFVRDVAERIVTGCDDSANGSGNSPSKRRRLGERDR